MEFTVTIESNNAAFSDDAAQDEEIERLRKIESAAVAAVEYEQWTGGTFYDLMIDLQKALHE